jgi:hypothetical protein
MLFLVQAHKATRATFKNPSKNYTGKLGMTDQRPGNFIGLAYPRIDIVFRLIIEYSSLMDFGP